MCRCRLSSEQWNGSKVVPMSTKASMNHYLGGQVKVCVFVPCIFFYYIILIIQSYLKLSLWRWTSGQPTSPEVCQQLHFLSQTSLSLPPATWEAKVEHEHWDIRQEREGKTGWLTGEVSPEGRLSALPEKKMTDSECLYCWQTWAPRGGWGERARMAKDVPEWG